MKKLAILLAISITSLSSLAIVPSDVDYLVTEGKLLTNLEYAKVSVGQLDIKLSELIENMNTKVSNLDDTSDLIEGKIRATIINSFESGVKDVEKKIEEFGLDSSVELQQEIIEDLRGLELLVKEL